MLCKYFEIEDSAAIITASNDQLTDGNIHVDVTDADVNASVGALI